MSLPLLSICIPTYNRASKLGVALNRLTEELGGLSSEDYEVFISDNASTDETGTVVAEYVLANPSILIRHFKQSENLGPDLNFGYLLTHAKGRHALLLSDDDQLIDGRIKTVISDLKHVSDDTPLCIDTHGFSKRKTWYLKRFANHDFLCRADPDTALVYMSSGIFFLSSTIIPTKMMKSGFNAGLATNLYQAYLFVYLMSQAKEIVLDNRPLVEHSINGRVSYNLPRVLVTNYRDFLIYIEKCGYASNTIEQLGRLHYGKFIKWSIVSRRLMLRNEPEGYLKEEMFEFAKRLKELPIDRYINVVSLLNARSAVFFPLWFFKFQLLVKRVIKSFWHKLRHRKISWYIIKFIKLPLYVRTATWRLSTYLFLKYKGVEVLFPGPEIDLLPIIVREKGAQIKIGKNCVMASDWRRNPAGISRRVTLAALTSNSRILIGSGVQMSGTVICAVDTVTIGDGVLFGVNSSVYDTDFHPVETARRLAQKYLTEAAFAPVSIGENSWIGAQVFVLKGAKIGKRSVIGAASVVTKEQPADYVCCGSPCKPIKPIKN